GCRCRRRSTARRSPPPEPSAALSWGHCPKAPRRTSPCCVGLTAHAATRTVAAHASRARASFSASSRSALDASSGIRLVRACRTGRMRQRPTGTFLPSRSDPAVSGIAKRQAYTHAPEREPMTVASPIRVDREAFERDGYVVIENVFDPAPDLDPVVQEYAAQLDELA